MRFIIWVIKSFYEILYFYTCPYLIFPFIAVFKWKSNNSVAECNEFTRKFHSALSKATAESDFLKYFVSDAVMKIDG
jgi:hypothetical protein